MKWMVQDLEAGQRKLRVRSKEKVSYSRTMQGRPYEPWEMEKLMKDVVY